MTDVKQFKPQPKFSVVVPIYNVERFLEECVKSIQNQSLEDIEIVLVDDGSTDGSGAIADKLALSDKRIKVVHKENGGLGPARNTGIAVSTGVYIGFVDSDDWIDRDMYRTLAEALDSNEADICYSGLRIVQNGKVTEVTANALGECVLSGQNEIFKLRRSFYGDSIARVRDDGIPVSVCVAGYRRSMLMDNNVSFENIRSEDIPFNAKVASYASSIVVLNDVFYNYRQDRLVSISKSFKESSFADFELFFETLVQYASSEDESYRNECLWRSKRRIIDYARGLGTLITASSCDRKTQERQLKKTSDLRRVRWALKGFPFWRLTAKQSLYCVALILRNSWLMWTLQNLRRHE